MTDQPKATCKDYATLYSKIAAVMGGLTTIQQDSRHAQGWQYASATQVFDAIRKLMAEQKLVIFMEPQTVEVIDGKSRYYRVQYVMTLACGDTGATSKHIWIHEGAAYGDRSLTGIHTNALKYFLMDLFVVSYGDAPDSDKTDAVSQSQARSNGRPQQAWYKDGAQIHELIERAQAAGYIEEGDGESELLKLLEVENWSQFASRGAAAAAIQDAANKLADSTPVPELGKAGQTVGKAWEVYEGIEPDGNKRVARPSFNARAYTILKQHPAFDAQALCAAVLKEFEAERAELEPTGTDGP